MGSLRDQGRINEQLCCSCEKILGRGRLVEMSAYIVFSAERIVPVCQKLKGFVLIVFVSKIEKEKKTFKFFNVI